MGNRNSTQPCKPRNEQKVNDDSTGSRNGKTKRRGNADVTRNSRPLTKDLARNRSTNPFIIFFLRLRRKKPDEHVTVVARAAGKLWTRMPSEQRKRYIDLANAEKKRREERRRKRKYASARMNPSELCKKRLVKRK